MARLSAQIHNGLSTEKLDTMDFMRFQDPGETTLDEVAKLMGVKGVKE